MSAAQFADATWIVALVAGIMILLSSDLRPLRYGVGLLALWLLAVVLMALAVG